MTYRDELEASLAQNRALRAELSEKEEQLKRLHGASPAPRKDAGKAQRPAREARGPRQGIRFVSPPLYFPLYRMWRQGTTNAFNWIFKLSWSFNETDTVLVWLLHQCARPLLALAKAMGLLAVVLFMPFALTNLLIHSVLLLPVILLSSFRFSHRQAQGETSWIRGNASADAIEFYLISLYFMPPLCFPGYWTFILLFDYLFSS